VKLLLDTCTFLWLIWDEDPLQPAVRGVLSDASHPVYLSAVSVWEATLKQAIEHGLTLVTPDPPIRRYPIRTLWE